MINKIIIIALSGKMASGKDYVARNLLAPMFLHINFNIVFESFAEILKEECIQTFEFTEEEVYKSKPIHVRETLQRHASQIRSASPNYFCEKMFENIKYHISPYDDKPKVIFVTDLRYQNELELITKIIPEKLHIKSYVYRVIAPKRNEKYLIEKYGERGTLVSSHESETNLDYLDTESYPWLIKISNDL